jgi:hypothetical protein
MRWSGRPRSGNMLTSEDLPALHALICGRLSCVWYCTPNILHIMTQQLLGGRSCLPLLVWSASTHCIMTSFNKGCDLALRHGCFPAAMYRHSQ